MTTPPVTAVIVTYHSMATIPQALKALRASYDAGLLECIVVDNDSTDGTPEWVEREASWATLIRSGGNLGFGRGNNLGLTRAKTPFVLFLNPDAVIEPDDLRTLLAFFDEHPKAGILGPAICNNGVFDQPCLPFPTIASTLRESIPGLHVDTGSIVDPADPPRRVDWLCGAVLLTRRKMLDQLGGFDPRFFLYFEETDLCYRARQIGFETWAVTTAAAGHVAGTSARTTDKRLFRGCIAEHYFRSRYYFNSKHHGRLATMFAESVELMMTLVRLPIRALLRRDNTEFKIRLRAPWFQAPRIEPAPVATLAAHPTTQVV